MHLALKVSGPSMYERMNFESITALYMCMLLVTTI